MRLHVGCGVLIQARLWRTCVHESSHTPEELFQSLQEELDQARSMTRARDEAQASIERPNDSSTHSPLKHRSSNFLFLPSRSRCLGLLYLDTGLTLNPNSAPESAFSSPTFARDVQHKPVEGEPPCASRCRWRGFGVWGLGLRV